MLKSRKTKTKAVPTLSRPWINEFPEEKLSSRATTTREAPDYELIVSVLHGCVVTYIDERKRSHVMEARAYGMTADKREILIGFQVEHGLVEVNVWKTVERVERVFVTHLGAELVERTIPPQHATQLDQVFAMAPQTALDLAPHAAEGY